MAKQTIYKLYAELDDCSIKVWREFEVDNFQKISIVKLNEKNPNQTQSSI